MHLESAHEFLRRNNMRHRHRWAHAPMLANGVYPKESPQLPGQTGWYRHRSRSYWHKKACGERSVAPVAAMQANRKALRNAHAHP